MNAASPKHYLLVLAMLVATAFGLIYAVEIEFAEGTPVRIDMPDQVGDWRGEALWFCVNKECTLRAFHEGELEVEGVCPDCGEALNTGSLGEIRQLPKDTIIRKKEYTHPSGTVLTAAIVVSGRERASIHRPQVCLTGGGQEIVHEEVMKLESEESFKVSVLDLVRPVKAPDGRVLQYTSYYAYWFVGKGHETPYHLQRMFWMASDRVIHSRTSRWAYVSVSGIRQPQSDAHLQSIRDFLKVFYAQIRAQDSADVGSG